MASEAKVWKLQGGQTESGARLRYHLGTLSLNVYPPWAPLATLQPQTVSASRSHATVQATAGRE